MTGDEHCSLCGKSHGEQAKAAESTGTSQKCSSIYRALNRMTPPMATATMLGVVECRCGKFYADNSGQSQAIVGTTAQGCECNVSAGIPSGTSKAFVDYVQRKLKGAAKVAFIARCKLLSEAVSMARKTPGYRTGFPPGKCAAQKAVVQALDAGAIPKAITEKFYCPVGGMTGNPITFMQTNGSPTDLEAS